MASFSDFALKETLLNTLAAMGFETPSAIQEAAIPLLKDGDKDFIGLAPTGTGKTAAFALPLLNKLDGKNKSLQALILCPTRELALQVATQINKLGEGMNLKAAAIYGGAAYAEQLRALRNGTAIIVGTPGRLLDHLASGALRLDSLQTLVLDEADEMISMGFQEDIETILKAIPKEQSRLWLFSATMSPEIRRIADRYLTNPAKVELTQNNKVPENLEQIYYVTRESNKNEILGKLIEEAADFYGLIFCQTKVQVTQLTQELVDHGYKADCLHGDKTQDARERTLRSFRERRLQILVCTDVASRGIDVNDITHVVNYSLPREIENYIHRIGRTARSGKKGIAMSLVTPSHRALVGRIEKRTGVRMKEGVIPSTRKLKEKKLAQLLEKFQTVETHPEGMSRVQSTWTEAIKDMTREEIAARLLALISPDLLQPTPAAPPADERPERRFERRDEGGGRQGYGARRFDRPQGPPGRPRLNRGPDAAGRRPDDGGAAERPARGERSWDANASAPKTRGPQRLAERRASSDAKPAGPYKARSPFSGKAAAAGNSEDRPKRFTPGRREDAPVRAARPAAKGGDINFREESKIRRKFPRREA